MAVHPIALGAGAVLGQPCSRSGVGAVALEDAYRRGAEEAEGDVLCWVDVRFDDKVMLKIT